MAGRWIEVVRLRFLGERFRDHALDLLALDELGQFQKVVVYTAKELWRAAHRERDRLPKNFNDRTRLCLRRIEDGSALLPLEVYLEEDKQKPLWEQEPDEVNKAVRLAYAVFSAIDRDAPLPDDMPKALIPEYAALGRTLAEHEALEIQPPDATPVRFTHLSRERLTKYADTGYEASARVTGKVLEADVRQMRFQLWLDERTSVLVSFTEKQESLVTSALKDHSSVDARVCGIGQYTGVGRLVRLTRVDTMEIVHPGPTLFDVQAPAIEQILEEIASQVPVEEWNRLPADLSSNLDHYIYGAAKE